MPIYDFLCQDCGKAVEVWLRSSTDAPICPQCGAPLQDKLLSAPSFVMSGDTLRQAGMTCCGREERCDSPACSTEGICRRG
jgi:putative FmdB family regulatory protein